MLELRNVSVGYGGKSIISNACAQLGRGELVSLLGANGAGKSTLIRTLSGEMCPAEGKVLMEGREICDVPRRVLSTLVSIVSTDRVAVEALSVREVVEMGRYPYTGFMGRLCKEDAVIVDEAMEVTGTARFGCRYMGALSDGERQKVMIARALAQQTPVVLLDEPTAFLDVASRVEVLALLRRLAAVHGKGVLLSSHDIPSALEMSDRIWLLPGDGSLLTDTPGHLIEQQQNKAPGNALDALFAGRDVRFDANRLDYVGLDSSGCVYQRE